MLSDPMQAGCSSPFCRETGRDICLSLLYLTASSHLMLPHIQIVFFPSDFVLLLYHLTIPILCLWMLLCELVNWSTELVWLTKYLKKVQVSEQSFPWSELLHFCPKIRVNTRSGWVKRDRTSPTSISGNSWACCTTFSISCSSFRDFGKDLEEGLYGLKTFHWSVCVHPVIQGFNF